MDIIFSTYEAKEIGGSYLRSLSLAQGLTELGHQVTLWTSAKKISFLPKVSYEKGVKVVESIGLMPYRFRKGGNDIFDICFRSLAIVFSECDVIQSFNHRPAATIPALIKSCFFPKTKWFLDWADLWGRGGIADRRYGPFSFLTANFDHYAERLFIRLAFAVTAISDDLVKKAKLIRKNKDNVFFLGVGANIKGIKTMSKFVARRKLGLSQTKKILVYLYVGTYDEELLAKTFIELNCLRKDVLLMLLGPPIPAFERQIKVHKNLNNKVIYQGVVDRDLLSLYLSTGDLMLLPFADKEINRGKFPNKLGDYLAVGRPTIANPTGEVKKLLTQEKVGILAPETPKKFASAIDKSLKQTNKLKQLGKNARSLADKLSWRTIAQELEAFYIK